jgi:aprataxin
MKRLQSSANTIIKSNKIKFSNSDNESIKKKINKNSVKQEKKINSKVIDKSSGLSFLSLEQSMNDITLQVYRNDEFVCIKDKYPKARVHLLLIPLLASTSGTKLLKLEQLIRLPKPIEFLKLIQEISTKIIDDFVIEEVSLSLSKIQKSNLICGFHAVQSMQPLHMHIISNDFQSNCLKNKKHWNSFNTCYFIKLNELILHLQEISELMIKQKQTNKTIGDEYFKMDKFFLRNRKKLDEFLKMDLKCNKCKKNNIFKTIPELKKHLEQHK